MTAKQTKKLGKEQKHLRFLMSEVRTLDSRIETDKDFARFMGQFAAKQMIKIEGDKAAEIFGDYLPDFYAVYTASDPTGMLYITSVSKKIKGGKIKDVITKPELLAQSLEGAVKYLIEEGENCANHFESIYDLALKLNDPNLIERIAKLIGEDGSLTCSGLMRLADKTRDAYLLNKAGEAMAKKGEMLSRLKVYPDAQFSASDEEYPKIQKGSERNSLNFASGAYRRAWKSKIQITNDGKLSKTFMEEKYDDRRLMRKVLEKLTGYSGKMLIEFEDKVYRTLNGIFDWNLYKKWVEDYKASRMIVKSR